MSYARIKKEELLAELQETIDTADELIPELEARLAELDAEIENVKQATKATHLTDATPEAAMAWLRDQAKPAALTRLERDRVLTEHRIESLQETRADAIASRKIVIGEIAAEGFIPLNEQHKSQLRQLRAEVYATGEVATKKAEQESMRFLKKMHRIIMPIRLVQTHMSKEQFAMVEAETVFEQFYDDGGSKRATFKSNLRQVQDARIPKLGDCLGGFYAEEPLSTKRQAWVNFRTALVQLFALYENEFEAERARKNREVDPDETE